MAKDEKKAGVGTKKTTILSKLKRLPRYDHALRTDGGSGWVEHYMNKNGDWIKVTDLESIIK